MLVVEIVRALQVVRDAVNATLYQDESERTRVLAALDLVDVAANAPRTIAAAEQRMLEAEEERDTGYKYLSAWTDWVTQLLPHPNGSLTRWDSATARERIGDVVVAARDWRPYLKPLEPDAVIGMPDAANFALARKVDALNESTR